MPYKACRLNGIRMGGVTDVSSDGLALRPAGPLRTCACLTHASLRMSSTQASGWASRHQWAQACSSVFSSPRQDKISSARRPTNCASSIVIALLSMAAAMLAKACQK